MIAELNTTENVLHDFRAQNFLMQKIRGPPKSPNHRMKKSGMKKHLPVQLNTVDQAANMAAFFFAILRGNLPSMDFVVMANLFSRRKLMLQKAKHFIKRLSAFLLAVLVTAGTCPSGSVPVHAADGTIQYNSGPTINYGSYCTTKMTFDGSNTAYCVEPLQPTPSSGTYAYTLLGNNSPIRKALYYLNGGYGYDRHIKNQYLGGWSDDNSYVIGHLVVAYIYAGYASDSGAFHGAPQNYIDKAVEVANAVRGLPEPPATFRAFIIPGNNDQTLVGSWYQVPYGYIELRKVSSNAAVSDGNGNYSLRGAEYGIYKGETLVTKLTTDQNGYAKSDELESGSYTVKELKASKGYIIDITVHNVTVEPEKTASLHVTEVPQNDPMDLLLQKLDKEMNAAQPQGRASLSEAQFTVKFYTQQSDTDPAADGATPARTWIFKTDSEGKAKFSANYLVSGDEFYTQKDGRTLCLPLGTVTVQETKAPIGYFTNDTVFVQKITAGGKAETVSCYNASSVEEQICRGGVKLQKRDFETKKKEPQGDATLEGAVFTITSLNENPVIIDGKTYTKNQVVMTLTTDSNGSASTKKDVLPFGHYRADETKAPEGYLNEGKLSVEFDITQNGEIVNLTSEDAAISNQVIRGDLELIKVVDGEQRRLSDVPFSITSVTTGESHTIVTDKNGYASTASKWNKHTHNTNQGKTSEDGIWFGTSKPDDSKGALPYDTYSIEEQRCNANESMDLLKFEVTIYKDSVSVDLGTLTDDKIEICTTALDKNTGTHMSKPEKKVTLIDTVEYSGLKKGQKYQIIGTLMDAETGEAILIDEKPVTAEKEFTAKKSSGSAEVTFTFDATSLAGKTTVIFEELHQDGKKLAAHTDLKDTEQQISFPEIGTKAKDSDTEDNIANADEKVQLTDTIFFKGLIPNLEYVAAGRLMDAETEEPLLDGDTPITAQTTFTPEASEGTVDVVFEFNGSSLKGKNTVIYESVTQEEKEVGMHADPKFKDQQMFFPEIGTKASCPETESQMAIPKEELTIVDTVSYHLVPGKEYKLTGTLMDKESGKPLLVDEKPVTSELVFTPEEAEGTVELSFTFNASALKGKTIVAFESVSYQEKEVAVHADIESTPQSIYFPEIGTKAICPETESQMAPAKKEVTITDTVSYQCLVPGKEYKLTGTLMDQENGEPLLVDKKPVTSELIFTPETADGTVELSFTFDASTLKNKTIVVFESLSHKGKELTVHADIDSEPQSIYFPEIGTKATCPETGSQMAPAKKELTIVDTVTYQRLIPGKEYKLTGTLMDQENGEFLLVDGKTVTSELVFTPEKAEGSVELSFTFDSSALKGKTVVAFESVSYQEKEVAVHADIESEPQSIYIPEIGTTAKDGKDGDQEALAEKETQIIDTVKYKDLVAGGPSYRLVGTLMDKETGKEVLIDGKPVTAETTFKPEESSGSIDVTFTFDATELKGHDVVVFEKLYVTVKEEDKDKEVEVTSHEDIKAKSQTVKLTEIPTEPKEPDISSPVKTGDEAPILLYICIAAGSLLFIIISGLVFYWRRKHQK